MSTVYLATDLKHGREVAVKVQRPNIREGLALDLATGSVVFVQNGHRSLAPASNAKLPLTYAALVKLGATYRIETDVYGEGVQDGTTWNGALVLKGNGDPTLSRADLRALASQLRAAGIRRVTDGVIGDESAYDARRMVSGWKAGFYISESPPLSALIVDRGRVISPASDNTSRCFMIAGSDTLGGLAGTLTVLRYSRGAERADGTAVRLRPPQPHRHHHAEAARADGVARR